MPTPLDRALQSKGAFFGFVGIISAASAWMIWGSDVFPQESIPTGDPNTWTREQLRIWLRRQHIAFEGSATKNDLLEKVKATMRPPAA